MPRLVGFGDWRSRPIPPWFASDSLTRWLLDAGDHQGVFALHESALDELDDRVERAIQRRIHASWASSGA